MIFLHRVKNFLLDALIGLVAIVGVFCVIGGILRVFVW